MHSVSERNRPEGPARCRPWQWPGGDAELPSNSAVRHHRWRKRSQSRSPTATAKLTCQSPSSHEPLRQTLRGQGKVEGWTFSATETRFSPPKISSSCPEMLISSSGTYLSLSTTPSMQAPNRITLDMSEQPGIRTATVSQRNVSGCQNRGRDLT